MVSDMATMKIKIKPAAWALSIPPLIFIIALFFSWVYGLRINLSASLPMGIYKIMPADKINKNDLIVFSGAWPIKERYVRNGSLLKQVQGMPGDRVSLSGDQVVINDKPLPGSDTFSVDDTGEPLPRPSVPYILMEDEYYAGSNNIYGYDSRYFGPVNKKYIQGRAILICPF